MNEYDDSNGAMGYDHLYGEFPANYRRGSSASPDRARPKEHIVKFDPGESLVSLGGNQFLKMHKDELCKKNLPGLVKMHKVAGSLFLASFDTAENCALGRCAILVMKPSWKEVTLEDPDCNWEVAKKALK